MSISAARDGVWGRCLALSLMALVGAGALGSGCSESGFECGREVPGKAGTFRRCDRANEVCVCHTSSCARRVIKGAISNNTSEAGEAAQPSCPSGLQYVKSPFARRDLASKCVPVSHLELGGGDAGLQDFAEGELICPGAPISPGLPQEPPATSGDSGPPEPDAGQPQPEPIEDAGSVPDANLPDATITDAGSDGAVP